MTDHTMSPSLRAGLRKAFARYALMEIAHPAHVAAASTYANGRYIPITEATVAERMGDEAAAIWADIKRLSHEFMEHAK